MIAEAPSGRIVLANDRLEEILGVPAEPRSYTDRRAARRTGASTRTASSSAPRTGRSPGPSGARRSPTRRSSSSAADGRRTWVAKRAGPVIGRDGAVVAGVATIIDISAPAARPREPAAALHRVARSSASSLDYEETIRRVAEARRARRRRLDHGRHPRRQGRPAPGRGRPRGSGQGRVRDRARRALPARTRMRRAGPAVRAPDRPARRRVRRHRRDARRDGRRPGAGCDSSGRLGSARGSSSRSSPATRSSARSRSSRRSPVGGSARRPRVRGEPRRPGRARDRRTRRAFREAVRYKRVLDATLDAVIVFDPVTLRISYVNQGAMDQLGYAGGGPRRRGGDDGRRRPRRDRAPRARRAARHRQRSTRGRRRSSYPPPRRPVGAGRGPPPARRRRRRGRPDRRRRPRHRPTGSRPRRTSAGWPSRSTPGRRS